MLAFLGEYASEFKKNEQTFYAVSITLFELMKHKWVKGKRSSGRAYVS